MRRLHHLLRLYEIPPHLVADVVELEDMAAKERVEGTVEQLYEQGIDAWRRGDMARGLACFFALRERVSPDESGRVERHRATLGFAIAARDLGKLRLAKTLIDELLLDAPAAGLKVKTLVMAASVWQGLGSHDVASALIRHAASAVDETDHELGALVAHQAAKVHQKAGDLPSAGRALDRAVRLYKRRGDTYGEARARLLRIGLLESDAREDRALAAAREALRFAERHGHEKLVVTAHLELGRLLVARGRFDEGVARLREALAGAIVRDDKNARFLGHHHLWKAYVGRDDVRARVELEAARSLAGFVDDTSTELNEIRRGPRPGGFDVS